MSYESDAIGWYVTQVLNSPCTCCGEHHDSVKDRYNSESIYYGKICDDCWACSDDNDSDDND